MTRCVPYLQLHSLAVQLDRPDLEVNADGCDERGCEGILAESEKTAGLSDAGVTYEEEFYLWNVILARKEFVVRTEWTEHRLTRKS